MAVFNEISLTILQFLQFSNFSYNFVNYDFGLLCLGFKVEIYFESADYYVYDALTKLFPTKFRMNKLIIISY